MMRIANQKKISTWPTEYKNSQTGKIYQPHHDQESEWINDRSHRYLLAKGGEGGGKTVAGIIRVLERIKVGAHGIWVSPDFEHFRRSLWPEARRWIPWSFVVPKQQYRQSIDWEPGRPFQLVFITGAVAYCGGIKENEVMAWEGPNVNWVHFDEPRRHKTPAAIKVLDGRTRIPMGGYNPQIWLTSTPRKHWLFDFFGPLLEDDPRAAFKSDSLVMTLLTADNEANLEPGFVAKRSQSLTSAEVRVLLQAEWEDIDDSEQFLPSMSMWDLCEEVLPAYSHTEAMVLALDAAIGGSSKASSFGIVGVTRHPFRHEDVAVRYVQKWDAPTGGKIDFGADGGPEWTIRNICKTMNVVQVCFDPYQLHDMATRLNKENVAWLKEFSQGAKRLEADRQLLDLVIQRRIAHKGQADLRQHIANANRKLADDGRRLRIVKREAGLNNDLAVCLSMASYEILRLNV